MIQPIATPGTDAWHALRATGIGASEAAAACGLSRYGQPLTLYALKRGERDPEPETDSMRRGRLFEPSIVAEFPYVTGINVRQYPCGLYRHPDHPFVLATPDAELETDELLETKITTFRCGEIGEEGTDNLPVDWVLQSQQQMAVMGRKSVRLAVFIDIATYKLFRVERNDTLIRLIIDAEAELWQRIVDGNAPEPNWEHPRALELVRELHQSIDDARIELSPEAIAKWERYESLGREIKELTAQRKALKASVLHEIGSNYAGILPGGKMIRRKLIKRAGYEVGPCEFIDARVVKQDRGPTIAGPRFVTAEEQETRVETIDEMLLARGFVLLDESESGGRYYVSEDGGDRVRVADHPPNEKTAAWMERRNCREIRVDDPGLDVYAAIEAIAACELTA